MNRKEFFKAACQTLGLGGLIMASDRSIGAEENAKPTPPEQPSQEGFARRFKEKWIETLMENMEKQLPESSRQSLMNACGRACARRGSLLKTAEAFKGNVAGFVEKVGGQIGKNLNYLEGQTVHWGYPRCFCELVAEGPERLPATYCQCSVGWVQEMFEIAAAKPVRVELVQSIKGGAPDCRFQVRL